MRNRQKSSAQEPLPSAASSARRGLGALGERLAARHLAAAGYEILARNWRCSIGELDLVARQDDCLVVVEVRTRRGDSLGSPEESLTRTKQARLIVLAEAYVQAAKWPGTWRIDVIAIEMDQAGCLRRVDHYENAVTG